ncbi:sugar phosphate isomerase/epimerase family protein [Paenibacillus aestuarii]|uniref:Sugar phosphate isomerase/epimerase family protein n=1 Tax=Paenibacillus aestuarii TaxID=516965 RepID=A0ABW0K202_9BACL|nr:TIM barrel protein [Paenibacillus aestuarii]
MKASIGAFSFYQLLSQGEMDLFGYLETVRYRYRLDAVDLWNGFFVNREAPIWELPADDELLKIKRNLDERQLTVANMAVDRAHLWDPDPDVREQLHRNALAHLRAAKLLGVRTVRIDANRGPVEASEEQFDYTVRRYREYAQYAADHGFTVGPENHTGISLDPHWMKQLAEAVDHPGYGILLHLNRWIEGEPGNEIVAPWVNHTHLDRRTLFSDQTEVTIKALGEAGYRGYWAIEYNATSNPYTEIEWALAATKRMLASAANHG